MQGIKERRQQDYERFEANRRFEEMTDIAERLGYPIDTTIHYEMRDGVAYALSDTVNRPFHNQTWTALQRGKSEFLGDQFFQQERLRLEHEEALFVDSFGRDELDGNVLIKYSKIPDVVVRGETSIDGYRRDLMRSFVRIYYKTEAGIDCRLFTLDGNNDAAVKRVGELLNINTTMQSEKVLAAQSLMNVSGGTEEFVNELIERTKLVYDEAHLRDTGRRTYAGSVYVDRQNAMEEIAKQSRLFEQHMNGISDIMHQARYGVSIENLLKDARRRTAAAIMLASRGIAVESSGDSRVTSEVANGNYELDCPTANNGMNEARAESMANEWKQGECLVCFAKTMVGSCSVCAGCEAADNAGVDLLKLRERNLKRRTREQKLAQNMIDRTYSKSTFDQSAIRKRDIIREQYGSHAVLRQEVGIGHAKKVVRDRRNNEVLA